MEQVRILRIVVASPNNVQAERDFVDKVAAELNRGIATERGLRLEVVRWEEDAYPGFHPEGPQGLIDTVLQIRESDVLIGIFWTRFGTPIEDANSATEHEIKTACEAWREKGRPQIMIYFNEKAYAAQTKEETDQWGRVLQFKKDFPKEGLWWSYNGEADFEEKLRNHLTQFILKENSFDTSPSDSDDRSRESVEEQSRPPSSIAKPQSPFSGLENVEELIQVLQDRFPFRWEPSKFSSPDSEVVVYWPVRLRRPTPIHAVQCFTATGLQRLGAKIVLFLDDYGRVEGTEEEFRSSVEHWFNKVSGNYSELDVRLFSETITPERYEEIWSLMETWLVKTDHIREVLEASKMLQSGVPMESLEKLPHPKPRRLLTPVVVWTCLVYLLEQNMNKRILTLGGYDECVLWNAWRRRVKQDQHSIMGHLYIPQLDEAEEKPLHMSRTSIAWDSKEDIENAFRREDSNDQAQTWISRNRLIPWCFSGCVLLPSFLMNETVRLEVDSQIISSVDDLRNLDGPERLIKPLAREVAKWIL